MASAPRTPSADGFGTARNVLVFGIDGILPSEFLHELKADRLPTFARLRKDGRYSDHARSVTPTWSKPNWASILFGADTTTHGVDANEWMLESAAVPSVVGDKVPFPNLFAVIKAQSPEFSTAAVYAWDGIATLITPHENVDFNKAFPDQDRATIDCAKEHIRAHRPRLTFIHLDDVDHAGHDHGSGEAYRKALQTADAMVREILDVLDETGMRKDTLVLIVSDHGRDAMGKEHGGWSLTEMETVWMAHGPMVPPAAADGQAHLQTPVSVMDTSPTVLHALGLRQPIQWRGRAVLEVFGVAPDWVWPTKPNTAA